jgi:SAM-dependent methyltransferase
MEISQDLRTNILGHFKYVLDDPMSYELEAKVITDNARAINKYEFTRLYQYLISTNLKHEVPKDILSITFSMDNLEYRIDINGTRSISNYCKTNSLEGCDFALLHKSGVPDKKPIYITDYNMKINLKKEIDLEDKDIIQRVVRTLFQFKKYYRLKKRYSFMSEDGLFRFDISVVKSSDTRAAKSLNILQSGLLKSKEDYEVELEFIKTKGGERPSDFKFLQSLFKNFGMIMMLLNDEEHLSSGKHKLQALRNYVALTAKHPVSNLHIKTFFEKELFVGPMPITLEKKHLLPPKPGRESIFDDYTVTDKADGERHLLFIDEGGKVFMMDHREPLAAKYTGLVNKNFEKTLIDGEYITRTKLGYKQHLFACFDIYWFKGEDVRGLPLSGETAEEPSRLKKLRQVTESKTFHGPNMDKFKIVAKTFYDKNSFEGKEDKEQFILKGASAIMTKYKAGEITYKIDGLIYTPASLPVGGMYKKDKARSETTWVKTLKWKPPEDNTVDFLIKFDKTGGLDAIVGNKQLVSLWVGYNPMTVEPITPFRFLKEGVQLSQQYINKLFQPPDEVKDICHVQLEREGETLRCENGDIIYDGSVAEMAWDTKKEAWFPLRVRQDKKRGNDWLTALSIWRSINNPVTEAMITGEGPIKVDESEALTQDLYYDRKFGRDNSASKKMLDFHNVWVKNRNMVAPFTGKANSIYDIACGKANDLHKYLQAKITTILGGDLFADNISNPRDGAYKRVLETKQRGNSITNAHTIVYVPLDFSQRINDEYIAGVKDEKTKEILEVLWGKRQDPKLARYYDLVSNKFDVVACQFAIHYFFESMTTLDNLVYNIDNALKDGGIFIGACLDGRTLDNNFRKAGKGVGESIEGQVRDGPLLWEIRKQYEQMSDEPEKNIGLKVDVFMETIGKEISEYLVDFELLENKLAKYGIRLLTQEECAYYGYLRATGTFDALFADMQDKYAKNPTMAPRPVQNALQMTDEEKAYSFMNRWFIFKKDLIPSQAPGKPKKIAKVVGKVGGKGRIM